ncbi:MAG: beta-glucosidase [Marinilabiliales bacterium]|nr:MAG: beta-glucosidase [Marinilabiliales bacterium]
MFKPGVNDIIIKAAFLFALILTGCGDTLRTGALTDEALLDKVQEQTLRYFTDFAHPESGMAVERSDERHYSNDVVTTGGTGFGIMAVIAGVERGFVSREDALEQLTRIVGFLERSERYHGAWSHWYYGSTGKTRPFSEKDNGGDIVETAFLLQGLLTAREYFDGNSPGEITLRETITRLWHDVNWQWYTNGQNRLYWHWSPDYHWEMDHPVRGYDECLIVYILAASSPTYPVSPEVYHRGWKEGEHYLNGNTYYGITLPLGFPYGGPLFFSHYSFLGLDPRGLHDSHTSYWEQNRNHTLINYRHCVENPNGFKGYSDRCWGLTASDNHLGYSAHSPTNDLGVITPTAALSSFPYTPEESMKALRFFYDELGERLFGEYGFYDAFSIHHDWYADNYLAIDQGPIVVMIENYRSGLLWELFMRNPEIHSGLRSLGFFYNHD